MMLLEAGLRVILRLQEGWKWTELQSGCYDLPPPPEGPYYCLHQEERDRCNLKMIDKDYLACSGIENSKVKPEDCRTILHVIKKGPFMTLYQVKIKIGQPVEHLSARTIRRIILDSGRSACVSSQVLALTQEMKIGRVAWCKRMMRWWGRGLPLGKMLFPRTKFTSHCC